MSPGDVPHRRNAPHVAMHYHRFTAVFFLFVYVCYIERACSVPGDPSIAFNGAMPYREVEGGTQRVHYVQVRFLVIALKQNVASV